MWEGSTFNLSNGIGDGQNGEGAFLGRQNVQVGTHSMSTSSREPIPFLTSIHEYQLSAHLVNV